MQYTTQRDELLGFLYIFSPYLMALGCSHCRLHLLSPPPPRICHTYIYVYSFVLCIVHAARNVMHERKHHEPAKRRGKKRGGRDRVIELFLNAQFIWVSFYE